MRMSALLRDGAEELSGKACSAVVRVPELAGHQRVGRQRSPDRKIGGILDDEALRGAAADAKGELPAGCPGRRIQPQLGQVYVQGPTEGLAQQVVYVMLA